MNRTSLIWKQVAFDSSNKKRNKCEEFFLLGCSMKKLSVIFLVTSSSKMKWIISGKLKQKSPSTKTI